MGSDRKIDIKDETTTITAQEGDGTTTDRRSSDPPTGRQDKGAKRGTVHRCLSSLGFRWVWPRTNSDRLVRLAEGNDYVSTRNYWAHSSQRLEPDCDGEKIQERSWINVTAASV